MFFINDIFWDDEYFSSFSQNKSRLEIAIVTAIYISYVNFVWKDI